MSSMWPFLLQAPVRKIVAAKIEVHTACTTDTNLLAMLTEVTKPPNLFSYVAARARSIILYMMKQITAKPTRITTASHISRASKAVGRLHLFSLATLAFWHCDST